MENKFFICEKSKKSLEESFLQFCEEENFYFLPRDYRNDLNRAFVALTEKWNELPIEYRENPTATIEVVNSDLELKRLFLCLHENANNIYVDVNVLK